MTLHAVRLWGRTVAALEVAADGSSVFEWDPAFAGGAAALGIDPSAGLLPVEPGRVYRTPASALPAVLDDALPSGWARDLRRASAGRRQTARSHTPSSRATLLAGLSDDARGALRLEPSGARGTPAAAAGAPDARPLEPFALAAMAALATTDPPAFARRLRGRDAHPAARALVAGALSRWPGPAMVGSWDSSSRALAAATAVTPTELPALVLLDCDPADPQGLAARRRLAHHRLARAAGIATAELYPLADGERRHLVARRSDRAGSGAPLHVLSLGALLQRAPDSTVDALIAVQRLTGDLSASLQLLRRRALALLTGASHGEAGLTDLLMEPSGAWRLAPALPPSTVGAAAPPERSSRPVSEAVDKLITAGEAAGLKPRAARAAIDEVRAALTQWPQIAKEAELPQAAR